MKKTIKKTIKLYIKGKHCILGDGKKSAYAFNIGHVNKDFINIVKSEIFDKSKLDHKCIKFCCLYQLGSHKLSSQLSVSEKPVSMGIGGLLRKWWDTISSLTALAYAHCSQMRDQLCDEHYSPHRADFHIWPKGTVLREGVQWWAAAGGVM